MCKWTLNGLFLHATCMLDCNIEKEYTLFFYIFYSYCNNAKLVENLWLYPLRESLGKIGNFYSWVGKCSKCLKTLSLFPSLRWTDSVMWYLFRWRVVYGSGRLSVWNLPPNEERKQVCASASERYLKFFHSKWRIDDSHSFFILSFSVTAGPHIIPIPMCCGCTIWLISFWAWATKTKPSPTSRGHWRAPSNLSSWRYWIIRQLQKLLWTASSFSETFALINTIYRPV